MYVHSLQSIMLAAPFSQTRKDKKKYWCFAELGIFFTFSCLPISYECMYCVYKDNNRMAHVYHKYSAHILEIEIVTTSTILPTQHQA